VAGSVHLPPLTTNNRLHYKVDHNVSSEEVCCFRLTTIWTPESTRHCLKYHAHTHIISKLYADQSVKARLDQGEIRRVNTRREVGQGCCLSQTRFNLHSENHTSEALEGSRDFQIVRQVIRTPKYAMTLCHRLKGMTDGKTETGTRCEMEHNVKTAKGMRC
jgi:hypothetical protein